MSSFYNWIGTSVGLKIKIHWKVLHSMNPMINGILCTQNLKNLFKNCHLLNIYTANMNDPYRPPQSCHKPPRERQRDENFSQEEVITRLQGQDFTAILPPEALIVSVESLQFRPDICQSLLILHGTKRNCNKMASPHARLDRYEYLRGFLVCLFLAHEMNVSL